MKTMIAMRASIDHDPAGLSERIHDATVATSTLLREVIDATCRRFSSGGQNARTMRIERLLAAAALAEAALALIDLELPQWQVRRIAYDGGEWYCALSRERELPDWLDQSIEGHQAVVEVDELLFRGHVECRGYTDVKLSISGLSYMISNNKCSPEHYGAWRCNV